MMTRRFVSPLCRWSLAVVLVGLASGGARPGGLQAAPGGRAADASSSLFVLPCEPGPWLYDRRVAVFNERLLIALEKDGLVKTLAERDVPAATRKALPEDLSACTAPACIKTLSRATGARIVLHIRVLSEGDAMVVFGTLMEGKTGDVVAKQELGRLATKQDWKSKPEEAARWVLAKTGVVPAREAPPRPAAPSVQPGLDLEIQADQASRPEAKWLLEELRRALIASGGLPVSAAPVAPSGLPHSHRAILKVDRLAIVRRKHHVRHYRDGQLSATVTIVDKATHRTVFVSRSDADVSEEDDHANEQAVLGKLVGMVVRDWMRAYGAENISHKIRTTNP